MRVAQGQKPGHKEHLSLEAYFTQSRNVVLGLVNNVKGGSGEFAHLAIVVK